MCIAARNDGKTVVTALWVEHSADIGMLVDAVSVSFFSSILSIAVLLECLLLLS